MQLIDPAVKRPLDRVMMVLSEERSILSGYRKPDGTERLTAETVSGLALDDFYSNFHGIFRITDTDGIMLREYFREGQEACEFVGEMHQAYPFMDTERTEYLTMVNKMRTESGLRPFSLPSVDLAK